MVDADTIRRRVETDLLDGELDQLIADAQLVIRTIWGPDRDVGAPLVVSVDQPRNIINLNRPADEDEDVEIVESSIGFVAPDTLTLEADDFRIRNGGRTIERLGTGTNPGRWYAGWERRVTVTYVPQDDQAQRDEVVIKLVILGIQYEGLGKAKVGDVDITHADYSKERGRLLDSLNPRPGLLLA